MGTHMNSHNICFHAEIRKINSGYPVLSGGMAMYIIRTDNAQSSFS